MKTRFFKTVYGTYITSENIVTRCKMDTGINCRMCEDFFDIYTESLKGTIIVEEVTLTYKNIIRIFGKMTALMKYREDNPSISLTDARNIINDMEARMNIGPYIFNIPDIFHTPYLLNTSNGNYSVPINYFPSKESKNQIVILQLSKRFNGIYAPVYAECTNYIEMKTSYVTTLYTKMVNININDVVSYNGIKYCAVNIDEALENNDRPIATIPLKFDIKESNNPTTE